MGNSKQKQMQFKLFAIAALVNMSAASLKFLDYEQEEISSEFSIVTPEDEVVTIHGAGAGEDGYTDLSDGSGTKCPPARYSNGDVYEAIYTGTADCRDYERWPLCSKDEDWICDNRGICWC